MSEELKPWRMDAYYYGFERTNEGCIDLILSAVACAGKAFHHTESWGDYSPAYNSAHRGETPVARIENAANDAAAELANLRARVAELEREAERVRGQRDTAISMLAAWCVAVDKNGSGWDDWDEHYKDAAYRPGPVRELLDVELTRHKAQWEADDVECAERERTAALSPSAPAKEEKPC